MMIRMFLLTLGCLHLAVIWSANVVPSINSPIVGDVAKKSSKSLSRRASPIFIRRKIRESILNERLNLLAAESNSGSSIMSSSFNLAKTILGAGILSLPGAVAVFSDAPKTSLPIACSLLLVMGLISAYTFSSIGRACELHDVSSFQDAWTYSVDRNSGRLISILIALKTFFSCLTYSIVVGDTFSGVSKAIGLNLSRNSAIIMSTLFVIFPLCMQKNLDALKYTSILGLGGVLYCAGFMLFRFIESSYQPNGKYFIQLSNENFSLPSFGVRGTTINRSVFILLSTLSLAFVAHYNAPKIWKELRHRNRTRFANVISLAFGFAALMYVSVMCVGFSTFGGSTSGFVLNNYSSLDSLATMGRLAIGLGIVCGYPLTFSALRDGLLDIVNVTQEQKRMQLMLPTTAMSLVVITLLALRFTNLGLVVALSGSLIASSLIYIIPAWMNLRNLSFIAKKEDRSLTPRDNLELLFNYLIMAMGSIIAVIGVFTTLQGASH